MNHLIWGFGGSLILWRTFTYPSTPCSYRRLRLVHLLDANIANGSHVFYLFLLNNTKNRKNLSEWKNVLPIGPFPSGHFAKDSLKVSLLLVEIRYVASRRSIYKKFPIKSLRHDPFFRVRRFFLSKSHPLFLFFMFISMTSPSLEGSCRRRKSSFKGRASNKGSMSPVGPAHRSSEQPIEWVFSRGGKKWLLKRLCLFT